MARLVALLAVVAPLGASTSARADTGVYVTESVGVGLTHDELAPFLGSPMHLRVGVGVRLGNIAFEPWLLQDLQTERDGAWHGVIGGTPALGSADLQVYGLDTKYIVKLHERLSAYVRGGPCVVSANGALAGYHGYGVGMGLGFQIAGPVRALGFLWSPLFFLKKGPKITGSLYLDQGYDFYRLRMSGAPTMDAHVGHVSVGFGLGSAF